MWCIILLLFCYLPCLGGRPCTVSKKYFSLINFISLSSWSTAHFKERIVFVRVSQSPNLKGLLDRMWNMIVGGQRPDFQDEEEAHTELQRRLHQMEPQPTLVVLDDVWSKSDLEKLTFKREGYTFLITTRYNRIVNHEWLYEKQLLEVSHAVPLFCVSAFGQESIPEKEDANLVMEVLVLLLEISTYAIHNDS